MQRCRDDLAQLWRDGALWAITEVISIKPGRALHVVAMAGAYTPRLIREIEAWAKAKGCVAVLFTGRRGWERKLPDYQARAIVMEKRI